jgi:drug/metabolite transporter (DMT)-like permease
MQMLSGGAVLALMGLAAGEWNELSLAAASARSWAALAYLLVGGTFIAFSAYSWLVRTTRPTLVATYAFVNPMVAVFLGWLLAGEPVGPRTVVAAALIVSSVALVSREGEGGATADPAAAGADAQEPAAGCLDCPASEPA